MTTHYMQFHQWHKANYSTVRALTRAANHRNLDVVNYSLASFARSATENVERSAGTRG